MPTSTDTETIHDRADGSPAARLAAIAHDLRSPLNAILGWGRILGMKHATDPELVAIAERIERSGRSQLALIEELSGLARELEK